MRRRHTHWRDQPSVWHWFALILAALAASMAALTWWLEIRPIPPPDVQYIWLGQPPPCAESFDAIALKRASGSIHLQKGSTQIYEAVVGGKAREPAPSTFTGETSPCFLEARLIFPGSGAEVSPSEWQDMVLLEGREVQWDWVVKGLSEGKHDGLLQIRPAVVPSAEDPSIYKFPTASTPLELEVTEGWWGGVVSFASQMTILSGATLGLLTLLAALGAGSMLRASRHWARNRLRAKTSPDTTTQAQRNGYM